MVIGTERLALARSCSSCKQKWQRDALTCLLHQQVLDVQLCKLLVDAGGKTRGPTA